MHEKIVAGWTADETIALGIVKPLYCSCSILFVLFFLRVITLERVGRKACAGYQLLRARTAHDRFDLTYFAILRPAGVSSKFPAAPTRKPLVCNTRSLYAFVN